MSPDPDLDTELPHALADAARSLASTPLDESAIERVRLAARQLSRNRSIVGERPDSTQRPRGRRRLSRLALGLATSLGLAVAVWQLVWSHSEGSKLYAQVRTAAEKVSTIHVVSEFAGPAGVMRRAGDLWFARGVGFACVSDELTRIDDGQFLWEYTRGASFGSRTKTQGPDWMLDQALDIKLELERHCRRFADGDKEIGSIPCRCYQVVPPPVPAGVEPAGRELMHESFVYVSADSLVRRMETHEKVQGQWVVRTVRTWEYDIAVPPESFQPNFGPQVEIVDADEIFQRLVDLRTAAHVTERDGLIYAVHRAVQFENGGVALMASVRGTEETLAKFPLRRRMLQPGLYFVEGPATHGRSSPQGHGWFQIELAQADHDGINVKWWVLIPRGRPIDAFDVESGKVMLDFGVVANGAYADEKKDAQGVRLSFLWKEAIPVSRPEPRATLESIVESVYADQALLRAIPFKHLDLGVSDVNSSLTAKMGSIEQTTSAEFAKAVAQHIQYWQRGDIDYQVRQGCAMGPDWNLATGENKTIPGAFLGYYSLVDDDTLKRFATQRPNVQIISLRHTNISNAGLAHLKSLESLTDLDLAETNIDDTGLDHLAGIQSLRRVNVTASKVTAAGIARLKAALPKLEVDAGKAE
ncbi:MAG: hypothetical protein JSS02_34315 [Planctomycetes bacterium]|nr:hypothetical protein [Planctomycetota bacterium]